MTIRRFTVACILLVSISAFKCTRDEDHSDQHGSSPNVGSPRTSYCDRHVFNDEQPIADKTHKAYVGGVVCASPVPGIDTLEFRHYKATPIPIAFVDVDAGDNGYQLEGYNPGRNCIYLLPEDTTKTSNKPEDLYAYVQTIAANGTCPATISANAIEPLFVLDGGKITGGKTNRPSSARIDEDKYGHMLVGVACSGGYWCDITSRGKEQPSQGGGHPKREIKGWFDRQYLSYSDGTAPPKLTTLLATTYPTDSLTVAAADSTIFKKWVTVAVIKFDPSSPPDANDLKNFAKKWGLDGAGRQLTAQDSVILRVRYKPGTFGDSIYNAQFALPAIPGGAGEKTGVGRHVAFTRDHPKLGQSAFAERPYTAVTDAAVRFGWDDATNSGETMWLRCTAGCCEVTPVEDKILDNDSVADTTKRH